MSETRQGSGDPGATAQPVSVRTPPRRWSFLVLALGVAALPAVLEAFDLLSGLERAAGAFLERHAPSPAPSGRVWILRLDDETPVRLGVDDPVALWSRVLDRAASEGVAKLVVLDPGSFEPAARARAGRPPEGPALILPSRPRMDPLYDVATGVVPPLPGVSERPFQEALLRFVPDADGVWRRSEGRPIVAGTPARSMAEALAPPGMSARDAYVLAFNRPAGALPSAPLWSFVRGDLGQAPWRGGTLIVCRDEALGTSAAWAPYGQALSEPRALAQLAESLDQGRLYREIPAAAAAPLFLALFLAAAFAASRLAPIPGLLAGGGAALALLAAAAAARVYALWLLPLSPLLPVAALGLVVGLTRRHFALERRLARAGVAIGQSRALHPLLRSFGLDASVLRRAVDLLELEGAALVDPARPDVLLHVAARGEQEPFARRAKDELPKLLEAGRPAPHLPRFGEGSLLASPGLYIVPRGATPMAWWEENRELVDRLLAALEFDGGGQGGGEARAVAPETQLEVFRSAASRTEAERVLLLRLLGRLPGGVLVCDLLGRPLLHNQAIDRLATALRLAPENYLLGLLRTSSGRDEPALWRALQQLLRDRVPWTFYAKTEVPEPRHYLFQVNAIDFGPAAGGALPREVLVLAATDVSAIARVAAARSEAPAAAAPGLLRSLNRMLDLLQRLHSGGAASDAELSALREELDAYKGGTAVAKDVETTEAVDLIAEIEKAAADARPIATEVGIELRVRGDELVPMALARPEALRRALALLLRKGVSAWRRAPTLWFQAYTTGTEVILRMSTEGGPTEGRRHDTGTRVSPDALAKAVEEAGGRFGVGEEGDCRLAFPALVA